MFDVDRSKQRYDVAREVHSRAGRGGADLRARVSGVELVAGAEPDGVRAGHVKSERDGGLVGGSDADGGAGGQWRRTGDGGCWAGRACR